MGRRHVDLPEGGLGTLPHEADKTCDYTLPEICPYRKPTEWKSAPSVQERETKYFLKEQKLTIFLSKPARLGQESVSYTKHIPQKKAEELKNRDKEHVHGWGLVVHCKFDIITSALTWFLVGLLIAMIIVLTLIKLGPLRGNVTGIFSVIFGILGLINTFAISVSLYYSRDEGLLK